MLLTPDECALFFKLHRALMFFVNERLGVLPEPVLDPDAYSALPDEARQKVQAAFSGHGELLDAFVQENLFGFDANELDIIRSWRHRVSGKFFIVRQLQKHALFLSTDRKPAIAYGVVALSQPFQDLVGPRLPVLMETVLLPFQGKIVYDGMLVGYHISFGPGIRRMLDQELREARARQGIVTSLPFSEHAAVTPRPRQPRAVQPAVHLSSRQDSAEIVQAIRGLEDAFCRQHLNAEYAELCGKLTDTLARKRPSPLLSGKPSVWASAIVRTIGWVNFLSDPSQTPHMTLGDIDRYFGISESSGSAKGAAIRKMLRIHRFDHRWSLPSKMDDNPLIWMLDVNGWPMDIRHAPREAQEVAFRKGLIPYIPADRV